MPVDDSEPRYRLAVEDADGNITGRIGSLYAKSDGTIVLQEGSGSNNEAALNPDGSLDVPAVNTDNASISDLTAVLEKTSTQSINQSTTTPVDWDSQTLDANLYSYDGSTDELTVSDGGDYLVTTQLRYQSISSGDGVYIFLNVNGTGVRRRFIPSVATNDEWVELTSVLKDLSANDTITVNARTNSSGGGDVASGASRTWANISKLG